MLSFAYNFDAAILSVLPVVGHPFDVITERELKKLLSFP
jgi:hypothetical protein